MASSTGRPKADTEPVMVRLPAALVAVIGEFRREQPHIPSRPEAIRILLKGQLVALGCIKAER